MQSHCSVPVSNIGALVNKYPAIGFSGTRFYNGKVYSYASSFLPHINNYGGQVGVGCQNGIDHLVRKQFPQAKVFFVQAPFNRSAYARRSTHLVHWVVKSQGMLIAFPASQCPSGVKPSKVFHGFGSGTWGTIALSVGLGIPVLVFIHSTISSGFPASYPLSSNFKLLGNNFSHNWWFSG